MLKQSWQNEIIMALCLKKKIILFYKYSFNTTGQHGLRQHAWTQNLIYSSKQSECWYGQKWDTRIPEYYFRCNLMSLILIYKRNVKFWKSSLALIACRNGGGEAFWDILALDDTHGLDSISAGGGAALVPFLSRLFAPCFGIMCWIRRFSRFLWLGAVQGNVCWKTCFGLDTGG